MGYLAVGKCHESLSAAVDAYYTSTPMSVWPAPKIGISYFAKDAGGWYLKHVSLVPEISSPPDTRLGAPYVIECTDPWTIPSTEVLAQAFGLGLVTLISAYLCAYLVGVLVAMFDK